MSCVCRFQGFAAAIALAVALAAGAAESDAPLLDSYSSDYIRSLSLASALVDGRVQMVASFRLAEHYHLYWRNPGDSGFAPKFKLVDAPLKLDLSMGELPAPDRFVIGPVVNYGYARAIDYLLDLRLDGSEVVDLAALGEELAVDVSWLVCRIECIPEKARMRWRPGHLVSHSQESVKSDAEAISASIERPGADGTGQLAFALEPSWAPPASALQDGALDWHLASFDRGLLELSHKQQLRLDPDQGVWTVLARPGLLFGEILDNAQAAGRPLMALLLAGRRVQEGSDIDPAYIVSAKELTALVAIAPAAPPVAASGAGETGELSSWLWAALFAFLGGIILNVMPCVLPVLSIKLGSIAGLAREPGHRREFIAAILAQTIGVLSAVMLLAALLLSLKEAEAALGWGFQLQSPAFVLAVSAVMLLVAMNLSGVFVFSLPLGRLSQAGASAGAVGKHFLSGLLIVVLASPCTAPFMVSAFAYAWQQPDTIALSIFLFLGLGLSAPYLLLMAFPAMVAWLPRPGAWGQALQALLAFPIYATVLWLLWVISQQVDAIGLAWSLFALWLLSLMVWCYGRLIQARAAHRLARPAFVLVSLLLLALTAPPTLDSFGRGNAASPVSHPSHASAWSQAGFGELRAQGHGVFINFTAAWCATCLWNEARVFSQEEFAQAIRDSGTHYLVADWTLGDSAISRALAEYGRKSVPTYVYYPPGADSQPLVLGQLPTKESVLDLLAQARR